MFSNTETNTSRRNWAVVYTVLAILGIAVLTPNLRPNIINVWPGLIAVCGVFITFGYTISAVSAYIGRGLLWLQNVCSWLGNAGLSVYVIAVIQLVTVEGDLSKTTQALGYISLLIILVSRSFRLQRNIKMAGRVKEIIRIANRNVSH